MLHDHDIPATSGDRGPSVSLVPVVLEAEAAEGDFLVLEAEFPGCRGEPSDTARQVVRRREAVPDEQHVQGGRVGGTDRRRAAEQSRRQADADPDPSRRH